MAAASSMDDRSRTWGPEIYVHFEFGFSWSKKQQPPQHHQITYRSRGPRERSPAFPRQVPAPNTNYLAAVRDFDQRQSWTRAARQTYATNDPNRHHQMQEYYQSRQPPGHLQVPEIQEPERPTRADAHLSHERGSSAPPPIGENPWDVSAPHGQAAGSDMASRDRLSMETRRKPLPASPSQFRLGEGREPWSAWSLPEGYEPDMHPKDDDGSEDLAGPSEPAARNSATYATNPAMVSVFSPEPRTRAARTRDLETGRARELEALSAAMMTVDNGFENQWWYQGRRDTVAADDDEPGTPHESPANPWSPRRRLTDSVSAETPLPLPAGLVSPLTDAAFSPAPLPASLLQRTMSTRSEELWFHERSSRGA